LGGPGKPALKAEILKSQTGATPVLPRGDAIVVTTAMRTSTGIPNVPISRTDPFFFLFFIGSDLLFGQRLTWQWNHNGHGWGAGAFLNPAQQFILLAVDVSQIVIRELGPLLFQLALGDVPALLISSVFILVRYVFVPVRRQRDDKNLPALVLSDKAAPRARAVLGCNGPAVSEAIEPQQ
jgi:hypothetical protein